MVIKGHPSHQRQSGAHLAQLGMDFAQCRGCLAPHVEHRLCRRALSAPNLTGCLRTRLCCASFDLVLAALSVARALGLELVGVA